MKPVEEAIRESERFERLQFSLRLVMDTAAISGAWFFSYYVRFILLHGGNTDSYLFYITLFVVAILTGFFFNYANSLYEASVTRRWRDEISGLFKTAVETFLTFTVIYYFVFVEKISRLHLLFFFVFLFILLVAGRYIVNKMLAREIKKGSFKQKVLLVGYGPRLEEYARSAEKNGSQARLMVSGCFNTMGHGIGSIREVESQTLRNAVDKLGAHIVIISYPHEDKEEEYRMIEEGMELFEPKVYTLPGIPKSYAGTVIDSFHNIPTLQLNSAVPTFGNRFLKRAFDLVSCTLGVVALSPLFIIIAALVKFTSKGPVFFKQKRVTRDGEVFNMYKFRSMRIDMPETGGAHFTEEKDPRVTPIGRILRKTSLDEIPQFFNVISGKMSLIGPRPERPELEKKFEKEIPGYHMRHRMKAGITGWAQVNGLRGNTSLKDRIDFDLYYIRNWSFGFDMKIIIYTFVKGFINKNAY